MIPISTYEQHYIKNYENIKNLRIFRHPFNLNLFPSWPFSFKETLLNKTLLRLAELSPHLSSFHFCCFLKISSTLFLFGHFLKHHKLTYSYSIHICTSILHAILIALYVSSNLLSTARRQHSLSPESALEDEY